MELIIHESDKGFQEQLRNKIKKPKLCLNMIVKNESHIIKDTLSKLLNKVQFDYWVISDTGSTDNTKEIIADFFKEKNIKGELFNDEWKDFGHNRTKALEHAFDKSEYLLIFDADDEIIGDFKLPILTKDSYHLQFGDANGTSYTRAQIINNEKKWKYIGVLHEIIQCIDNYSTEETIKGNYYTISGKSGDRSRDPNKYLKDALILEKAYEEALKNNNELYNRYGFYCANSYFDCGKYEDAIKWYKITLDNKNWNQEKYLSCLKIYHCYNALKQKETGFFYLVKSFSYDKERVECLYELVTQYTWNDMNDVAYNYYNNVKSFYNERYLKDGLNDKLFLDVSKSNFFLPYYMILVSDKVQDYDTTIQMYRIIFTKKHIEKSKFFIGNMLYNLQFFIERVKDDGNFIKLFQEYIDFLISINYPIYEDEFMNKYEKYGVFLPKMSEPKFSLDECRKSNKIMFYTGYSPFKWNYTYSINNALGGSETAITCLTKCFPENYEIYVAGDVTEEKVDNITYVHLNNLPNLINSNAFHSIIVSRYLNFYELYKNFSAYQTFIWGHDVTLYAYGTDLSVESILTKWSSKITGCVCQTEWHKNLFLSSFPQLKDKITIINNGINSHLFNLNNKKIANKFVYTSCSERGLAKLIQLWPSILENLPDAELFISSYNNFPKSDEDNKILEFIKKSPSIKHVGKLNRKELYELMSSSEYWLYPSYFQETSCITSLELLASEVICLYYPVAGLVNTVGDYGIPISEGNEIDRLLNLSVKQKIEFKKKGKEYALACSWKNRAEQWCNMIFSNELPLVESPSKKNNIKIINLKRREDRKNSMIEQFERENIKSTQYEFIEAVDGNELIPTSELFSLFEGNDFNYKKGVIGCALSHMHLWNELINDQQNDFYVILEDDIKLCDNFKQHLVYVCKIFVEQNLEHLALGEYLSNKEFPNKNTKIETYKKDLYKEWNCFFAYILSKSAALKSINYINNCSIKCAIDNPQAFGYILQYSSLNNKLVHCEIVNEHGSDIQSNSNNNFFNFTPYNNSKEELKIAFCDWWNTEYCGGVFDNDNNFFTNLLREYNNNYIIKSVSPNENPNILFYSIFGNSHKSYSAGRKIFFSGEPYKQREDANFNITFDANSCTNTRLPLWLCYFDKSIIEECTNRKNNQNIIPNRDKFCSFIATGPGLTNNREEFVKKLSKYKQVDCGGSYLNNIGYNVPLGLNCSGKIEHNNNYKFAMAFESTIYPGYITEKICDIFKSNCIPIYWGHPDIVKDFNPSSFINANDFANFDELIEYIIKVDSNEELYKSFFKQPMLTPQWLDFLTDPNKTFYKNLADCIIGKYKKLYDNYLIRNKNNSKNIIFFNTSSFYTGIYHYGLRLFNILKKSTNVNYHYFEINDENKYYSVLQKFVLSYSAIIYNYTGALWPWLNKNISKNKNIKHIGIPHEEYHKQSDYFFDIILNIDPIKPDTLNSYAIPRPIYEDVPNLLQNHNFSTKTIADFINYNEPNIPIIGSFGFGFNTKGFDDIISLVNKEYDNAIIKLVITFPYNNKNDILPLTVKESCERNNVKSGIKLLITHEFFSNEDILYFLTTNTINIFLYNDSKMNRKRSISSVIDYALSVNKPIGISSSSMFINIYNHDICLEKVSIKQCIDNYPKNLDNIKNKYSHNKVIQCFDNIIKSKVIKKITFKNMNNLDIKYGTVDKNIDIKQKLIQNHKTDNLIYISDIDDYRANLFTDPIIGVEKYIFIKINYTEIVIDQNFYIYIDTENNKIYINCNPDTEINSNQQITFNNLDNINKKTYSQASQDIFVTNILQHKQNGYFLEIGSNEPINTNNSYLLESEYNFKGLLVEYDKQFENAYKQYRPNSIYVIDDARNINYKKILDDNKFPQNIDYLQIDLDVDNKSTLDTLILLNKTVFDKYKFATITFEHDIYRGNFFNTIETSREIFKNRGYLLVFPNISTDQGWVGYGWQPFEDWYVHPDLVDMDFVNIITKNNVETRNDYIRDRIITNFSNYINFKKCKSNNKMKVIFTNNCSVGDIFFSQPLIKNIVTNNPEYDYYIYHTTTSYYFTDILNIKDVNKIPELKEELYKIFDFKIDVNTAINLQNMNSTAYRYDATNNILLICTWLGRLRQEYNTMVECDMISYNETYRTIIKDINRDLKINLKYNDTISLEVYPEVPTLNIDKYREFKNKNFEKKIIFYYNFLPSSGQKFPIKNYEEHNRIILTLAENNIVVITNKKNFIGNNKNIYFADDFLENVEYYDAKNFYHHAQMAYESDYSIYFDFGRSFMSMNKTFIEDNNSNIRLHITNNEYYYNTLNNNFLIPKNYMKLIKVDNYNDIDIYFNNVFNVKNKIEEITQEVRINDKYLWIIYAFNGHNFKVIEDYINSLKQNYNIVYTKDINYVLSSNPKKISYVMYINDDRILNKFKNTSVELSFLNTEPLSISYNLDLLKQYINKYPYLKIYDYNFSNLQIILHNNMYGEVLEYQFYENENSLLKLLNENEPKIYDFGIITYGKTETNTIEKSLYHKKKEVVSQLIEKGFKIHIISGWGIERDKELAKCKVILNLHSILGINGEMYYSKTFENIRCNRLLDAGFKILSEDSIHCNKLTNKYRENMKFINYEDFKNIGYSEDFWDKIDNNRIKKFCFIHSCNVENVGTYRLDYLVDKLNSTKCIDVFDKIYILNIGLPIKNIYGNKFEIVNYSDDIALYENPTINLIKKFSELNANSYILYIHTKGVRYNPNDNKENDWIDYMLYFLLENSELCISILDNEYETVGCSYSKDIDRTVDGWNICDPHSYPSHYSGNFWWANSNYLRTLPLLSIENPDRMAPEFWLFKNNPIFYNLHSSQVLHFITNYPKNKYVL